MSDLSKYPRWPEDQPDDRHLAPVNDELWERFSLARQRVKDELGLTVYVVSAYRFYDEQLRLYKLWLAGKGNLAAPPGSSNHERGLAMDLGIVGRQTSVRSDHRANGIFYELGQIFPVRTEDWHVELDRNRKPLPQRLPTPPVQKVSTMHTASNLDGRLEEFDLYLSQVVHRWQTADFQSWSGWTQLKPIPKGMGAEDMSVGRTHDGRLEVTVRCPGGIRWRCWQRGQNQDFDQWVPA